MDLELTATRAFVAVADERHFGHAATTLGLSQQTLSKRVARLESMLGVRLLDRDHRGVRLTDDGARFLPGAREVVAAADRAVAALRHQRGPLRLEVWGHLYAPLRILADLAAAPTAPPLQPGHGRDLPSVAAALLRGDIDAGIGRVHPPLPTGLAHRPVRFEPVDVFLGERHPLAEVTALRPDQLAGSALWSPAPLDRLDFLAAFADRFGIRAHRAVPNLGAVPLLSRLATDRDGFLLLPADLGLPVVAGVRAIPLVEPTPLYAWSLLWRTGPEPDQLPALLAALEHTAAQRRWLEVDPARDWLPGMDDRGGSGDTGQADAVMPPGSADPRQPDRR
ncbi:LysR family transcriptional regulator [Nocardia rhizosphaerae]|uniref:LysR family transcriptional regulator n=1 Tax=Nocardia rhizosphaerae TaxID=1691571 RepID=A0ABV8LDD7_9NOCA